MRKLTQIAAVGAASLVVAGVGTAYAASGAAAPSPVIHACKANRGGAVRIVAPNARCNSGETRVKWNQRGVPGPRGPQGKPGPQGPRGPQGASGRTIYREGVDVPSGGFKQLILRCPTGKVATGGGYILVADTGNVRISQNSPDDTDPAVWKILAMSANGFAGHVTGYVVCVSG